MRRVRFDAESVGLLADLFGGAAETTHYRVPGRSVWQIAVAGRDGRPAALLTLWPAMRRVDVVAPGATVAFTRVTDVHIVPGVEAAFGREDGGRLIVAVGGKIIVRA